MAKCYLTSPYKFKTLKEDDKYHCSIKCDDANPKYTTSDYLCYNECPALIIRIGITSVFEMPR